MPESIHTAHAIFTLIAVGILVGAGWALIHQAVQWPAGRAQAAAAVICVLLLALAWLV